MEQFVGFGVASFSDCMTNHGFDGDTRRLLDFAIQDHAVVLAQNLARQVAVPVFRQMGVQNGICVVIANLIWVTFDN